MLLAAATRVVDLTLETVPADIELKQLHHHPVIARISDSSELHPGMAIRAINGEAVASKHVRAALKNGARLQVCYPIDDLIEDSSIAVCLLFHLQM
jgi:hypothetical protein